MTSVPGQPSTWIEVARSSARRTAEDYSLVLEARGIPNGIGLTLGQHVVLVRAEDADRARVELARFVGENLDAPPRDEPLPLGRSLWAAAVYILVLVAFDAARHRGILGEHAWRAGAADAAMIRAGDWWRSFTALTLHADVLHLAGNLAFGAAFLLMVAQSLGYGSACLAFLVTGGIGNWLNAWLQQPPHASIGASTGVFGLLGVLVAHDWVRRRQVHYNLFRRWAPIAIGAALLAWFGGDGRAIDPNALPRSPGDLDVALPRIDVWAHVLGFAAGVALGGLAGWNRTRTWLTDSAQAGMAAATVVILAVAWILALP